MADLPGKRLRRHERKVERAAVQILWKDGNGIEQVLNGHTVDVSETGMRVLAPTRIDERIYVNFRAEALKLHGSASIRRCAREGSKYLIGMEFAGGLRWGPKTPVKPPGASQ